MVQRGGPVGLRQPVRSPDTHSGFFRKTLHQWRWGWRPAGQHFHGVGELEALRIVEHGDHRDRRATHVAHFVTVQEKIEEEKSRMLLYKKEKTHSTANPIRH